LCPNCARQGQITPNGSKRNQKLVEKLTYNQLIAITTFSSFQKFGLKIPVSAVRFCPSAPYRKRISDNDLISFYYENRGELDQKIKQDQEFIKRLKGKFPSKMV
jgi:hypothetical protein